MNRSDSSNTSVVHTIEPVFDEHCRVLMLGSIPSPLSRKVGFFYGNPQNRFWRVMARVLSEPLPESIPAKCALLLRNHIALWDVLASCTIEGASDASIRNAQPNDFAPFFQGASIEQVLCTGAKAYELYVRYCEPLYEIPVAKLPSTSPANASWCEDALVEAYSAALRKFL